MVLATSRYFQPINLKPGHIYIFSSIFKDLDQKQKDNLCGFINASDEFLIFNSVCTLCILPKLLELDPPPLSRVFHGFQRKPCWGHLMALTVIKAIIRMIRQLCGLVAV